MYWFELSMAEQFNLAAFGSEVFPHYAERLDPRFVKWADPLAWMTHRYSFSQ
jgi:hypothetical protein